MADQLFRKFRVLQGIHVQGRKNSTHCHVPDCGGEWGNKKKGEDPNKCKKCGAIRGRRVYRRGDIVTLPYDPDNPEWNNLLKMNSGQEDRKFEEVVARPEREPEVVRSPASKPETPPSPAVPPPSPEAPTVRDKLEAMNKTELVTIAHEHDVTVPHNATKADIVTALVEADIEVD